MFSFFLIFFRFFLPEREKKCRQHLGTLAEGDEEEDVEEAEAAATAQHQVTIITP